MLDETPVHDTLEIHALHGRFAGPEGPTPGDTVLLAHDVVHGHHHVTEALPYGGRASLERDRVDSLGNELPERTGARHGARPLLRESLHL